MIEGPPDWHLRQYYWPQPLRLDERTADCSKLEVVAEWVCHKCLDENESEIAVHKGRL